MWYKNIARRFFALVTILQSTRVADGQTDGQNYNSQDRGIAASRGKNPTW